MLKIPKPNITLPNCITIYIDSKKPLTGGEWDDKNSNIKAFKEIVRRTMEVNQNKKCAFCGNSLYVTSNSEIEHIAPKGGAIRPKYVRFTFEILNLVLACHLCNSPLKKGLFDTISVYDNDYTKCKFKIVHPYFDDVELHFGYVEGYSKNNIYGLIIQPKTTQAKESVRLFNLNNDMQIKNRYAEQLYNNAQLNDFRQNQIQSVISYKLQS